MAAQSPSTSDGASTSPVTAPRRIFALVDAAAVRDPETQRTLHSDAAISLFQGDSEETYREAAPYLLELGPETPRLSALAASVRTDMAGVYVSGHLSTPLVRRHLRKFLMIATPDGAVIYFRYYDPRVLIDFLPTCDPAQLSSFFGPIEHIWAPIPDGAGFERFGIAKGRLRRQTFAAEPVFAFQLQ